MNHYDPSSLKSTMREDFVEIEEHYKGGQVVRRYINGVEFEPDATPTAIQLVEYVVTKTLMTLQEFKHKYPLSNNLKSQ